MFRYVRGVGTKTFTTPGVQGLRTAPGMVMGRERPLVTCKDKALLGGLGKGKLLFATHGTAKNCIQC